MLGWMLYVVVVTVLLSAAALAAERSAQLRRAATRWVWVLAILASLAVPSIISSVAVQPPRLIEAVGPAAPSPVVVLRQMTSRALKPSAWLDLAGIGAAAPDLDGILTKAWIAASAVLALGLMATGAQLYRRLSHWEAGLLAGRRVLVSEDVGPAVVGLLRPRIVVPRWIVAAPPELQELAWVHEQSHLDAGDARLLAIAILLVVAMPWNLPLWWQLRRLRFAIEVDCDARVLNSGRDVSRYGEALIAVGEHQSARIAVVAAMTESKSFLEQRLNKMISKRTKFAWASAAGLAALGVVLAASAAEVSPPNATAAAHQEVSVDPKLLDGYAGYYMYASDVFTVQREDDHLVSHIIGAPPSPLYAESRTRFFSKWPKNPPDLLFTFVEGAGGRVSGVTMHENGLDLTMPRLEAAKAHAFMADLEVRVKAQTQSPGTEAAMRRLDASVAAGAPDYDLMTPLTAQMSRPQLPLFRDAMARLGPILSVQFLGVSKHGLDVYNVRHENGVMHWGIALDDDGKILAINSQEGP